ncbi:hypothetical protein [Enemella sp. A6]|uniref:hypothetical protein n=1 Tax=Enemella sp. A6 TaxID=3440152 RepID=UPI003EBA821D
MPESRMLVASYAFTPYNDTAGIVAAKRVRESGRRVDVIANALDSIRRIDSGLTQIAGEQVDRFVPLRTPSAFSSWPSIFHYTEEGYRVFRRWETDHSYDKLYSRAQFTASHVLAARIKLARPDLPWVAEFSDPLSHDVLGAVRRAPWGKGLLPDLLAAGVEARGFAAPTSNNSFEWAEVLAFALADEFIFTNDLQQRFMLEHSADPSLARRVEERSRVSPHPTLPREFYDMVHSAYELPPSRVNIGYFGNFYVSRGVGLILDAIARSPRRIRDAVALHVFTAKPEELEGEVAKLGIEDAVRVNPFVDYLEFLNLADKMDVLLVNDAVTPPSGTVNPFLPSKWSDYKGSTSKVWAVIEEGSTLAAQPGIDYRSPVEHFTALQATLADIVREH